MGRFNSSPSNKLILAGPDVVMNKFLIRGIEPALPVRAPSRNPPKALPEIQILPTAHAPDGAVQLCHFAEAFFQRSDVL
jgi:hypothetical protein